MDELTTPKTVLVVGEEISDSQLHKLKESGFNVKKIEAVEQVREALESLDPRVAADLVVEFVSKKQVAVQDQTPSYSPPQKSQIWPQDDHRFLQDVIDGSPSIIFLKDLEGRFITINTRLEEMLGMPREELVGKTDYDLFPPDIAEYYRAHDREVMETGRHIQIEEVADLKDGHHVFLANKFPLIDESGRIYGVGAISHDITEQKQAEQELRDSAARLDIARRAARLGISDYDVSTGNMMWDQRICELWGVGPDEPMDFDTFLKGLHPDDIGPVLKKIQRTFDPNGDSVFNGEYRVINLRDGLTRWIAATGQTFFENGKAVRIVGMVEDITDRKQAEQNLAEIAQREHHIADVLQRAILPADIPVAMKNCRIAVRYRPALKEAEIGGDFYDVFDLGEGKIGVLIGDVAGKGLMAAIRVASARHSIRSYAYIDPAPASVLRLANEALCKDSGTDLDMLTAFFAILDCSSNQLIYANAGHEPPIVCCRNGVCEELDISGVPLGVMPDIHYQQSSIRLAPGDVVALVTDGITEAKSPEHVLYGKESLIGYIHEHKNASIDKIADGILDEAVRFSGGRLHDDAAIVVFSVEK